MSPYRFLRDESGSPSTEFALLLPLLIVLLFGGSEAGHFVWTQHKLVEAVRDGARYASRLSVDKVCDGSTAILTNPELADIKLLTRTGHLLDTTADGTMKPVVPGWRDEQVSVTVSCESFVDTGIYADLNAPGPIVTVTATGVAYPSLFNGLGALAGPIALHAKSSAAVIGI